MAFSLDSSGSEIFQTLLFYTICVFVLSLVVYVLYHSAVKGLSLCSGMYESFHLKEGMSPANRWNRSARYLNKYNGLVASNKQYKSDGVYPIDSNPRGDRILKHLLKENKDGVVAAEAVENVSVDTKPIVPDTSDLPAVVQKGTIENGDGVKDYTNPRINPTIIQDVKLSDGNVEGGLSVTENFRRKNRKD
jgi:altronate dehydratase